MDIFGDLDHRLSVVKRWGILHTVQEQSVAEHQFNVARIALRIAISWFDMQDKNELYLILRWALEHDDLEALTGDLPSMVKPYFDEAAAAKDHIDLTGGELPVPQEVRNIVKLADKMEGMYFLAMEMALGNQYCEKHYYEEFSIINRYARHTFTTPIAMMVDDWLNDLRENPPRSIRWSKRGR